YFTHAERVLKEHFNVLNLQCFGIEDKRAIISASGALIEYLNETQKHSLINISKIIVEEDWEFMSIDSVALKNLEIVKTLRDGKRYGSLLWLIDNTSTPMGSRYLYDILTKPLQSKDKINYRLDGVEELYKNTLMRNAVRTLLETYRDTERLAGKISNNVIEPKDVVSLSNSLSLIPQIKFSLSGSNSKIINDVINNLSDFSSLTDLIKLAIKENPPADTKNGDFINDGFDKELDRLRQIKLNSKTLLTELELREKESTGIKTLKIGFNKVFGYYIEVSNSFKDKVPYTYVRKQTLVNGERFITEELKNLEDEILNSSEKAKQIENEIFTKIKGILKENITKIITSSKCIAVLDSLISLAVVAKKYSFTRPKINDFGSTLNIKGGRHPVVEGLINEQFVPNDTLLDCLDNRMLIITGPNMAGKSTYMRQIAIITILSHIGSFVPCESAEIPLVDKIFTRVGASDSLISEQSTFMVEMSEVANILNKATKNSLIILDEVGRGTSTYDGLSIAWAVVEYIAGKIKAKTLFATHYHELSELEGKVDGVKNYKVTVKEFNGKIIFLRKIVEGSANKSFGIEVASLAGVPSEVTKYAKKVLKDLENSDLNNAVKVTDVQEEITINSPLEDALSEIDVDNLSPREALDLLYSLKKLIK
ncbi:MAG: DNA mismatch repair protein MutS, partial [Clostridia bacterium]|nr:DNA mismatch repair protein MutS [Clostridia bacterium]